MFYIDYNIFLDTFDAVFINSKKITPSYKVHVRNYKYFSRIMSVNIYRQFEIVLFIFFTVQNMTFSRFKFM